MQRWAGCCYCYCCGVVLVLVLCIVYCDLLVSGGPTGTRLRHGRRNGMAGLFWVLGVEDVM